MKRIGVDVGGTFTDLILVDDDGSATLHKLPSTPSDPSEATIRGALELCAKAGVEPSDIDQFFHGTTVATNIVLEHNGARAGMITTEGFRDILHIARHKRPLNYSLHQELPWQKYPLVERANRLTVPERLAPPNGEVLVELDEEAVRSAAKRLADAQVEAVAICFLFSFLNPDHELRAAEIVQEHLPEAYISLSHQVAPMYREYERFSTTALNAYVGRKTSRYIDQLTRGLRKVGVRSGLRLMQSNGGVTTPAEASRRPVTLLMSGPAAGVIGGAWASGLDGLRSAITLDVGGTSADVGVAPGGRPKFRHLLDTKIGGYDVMTPMLDVDTIGAGGGSVAYVDAGGMFRVGPRSAGARPGPAGYGRGGLEATATDANLVLGRLLPDAFLGGRMVLDRDLALEAVERHVATPLDMSVQEAAMGIVTVLNHNMIQAIELNSVRKGYDPRDFALVALGGAGPLHACEIALELEIPTVVVPAAPGITAAVGLLATDVRYWESKTVLRTVGRDDAEDLTGAFGELESAVRERLTEDGISNDFVQIVREVDCRYVGQGYELRVPFPSGVVTDAALERVVSAYHHAHDREYGSRFDGAAIELVNIHVTGIGIAEKLHMESPPPGDGDASDALIGSGPTIFVVDGENISLETPRFDRKRLRTGNQIAGPAVILQEDSTTVLPPGFVAGVSGSGNLVVQVPVRAEDALAQTAEGAIS